MEAAIARGVAFVAMALALAVGASVADVRAQASTPSAPEATVARFGDENVSSAQLAVELGGEDREVLDQVRRDGNFAKVMAVRWYESRLLLKAASDEGLLRERPELAAKATGSRQEKSEVVAAYVDRMIERDFAPSDAELESYSRIHPEVCSLPARVHLAQMGIKVGDAASPEEGSAAKERVEALRDRVLRGEAFATVADSSSEIPGKSPGGDLGWAEVAKLGQAEGTKVIQATPVGQMSSPIRTQLGWQVYLVVARDDGGKRPADECKKALAEILNRDYRKALLQRRVNELAAKYKASMNLDAFIETARTLQGVDRSSPPSPPLRAD